MATKKPTAKAAPKKTAAKKPVKKTAASTTTVRRVVTESSAANQTKRLSRIVVPKNLVNIVVAETIGTFMLTLIALTSVNVLTPLYVGIGLALIVMTMGAISGAHINPAVTFGLWSMRKLKTSLVPFYWAAQFLGAMAAAVLLGVLSNSGIENGMGFHLSFNNFMEFSWGIFAIELIGSALFMMGIAAVVTRTASTGTKAAGIGAALTVGLLVANVLFPYMQSAALERSRHEEQKEQISSLNAQKDAPAQATKQKTPHELLVSGATLNPAVALAVTEKPEAQNTAAGGDQSTALNSRLSLEVIAGTLIGAALGGNLLLLIGRNREEA